jgi:type IX secretion system PorP/SprF family membrane protein
MNKSKIVVVLILSLWVKNIFAQQQAQFTQYMYTPLLINPAYAGMEDVMSISLLHRSQWVGVNGAPVTQVFALSTPLNERLGMGFSIIRDEIGPATESNISADISYILQLNDNDLNLSFGIKGGFQYLNVDFSKLTTHNPNDPSINENINARFSPNIGAGFYLYNSNWYLGLSSPNLLSTEHFNNTTVSKVSNATHFYLIGGRSFPINENIKFKPAFMLKGVSGSAVSLDISANFLFNNSITAGVSYRNQASISGLLNIKVTENLSIGYAYDHDTSDIRYFSGGSHEVILNWSFTRYIRGVNQPSWMY